MNFWSNPRARILLVTKALNSFRFLTLYARQYLELIITNPGIVLLLIYIIFKMNSLSAPLFSQEVRSPIPEGLVVMDPNVFDMFHTAFVL